MIEASENSVTRAGDRVALLLILLIYAVGFFTRGFVAEGTARLVAWSVCALLGIWAAAGMMMGRWKRDSMRPQLRVLVLVGAAATITLAQLLPLPRAAITFFSPLWRETVEAIGAAGRPLPDFIPFAVAPEKGWTSWNQLVAAGLFFAGVSVLVSGRSATRFLIHLVAFASIFEGVLGVVNFGMGNAHRVSAAIFNPNHHSTMVMMGMPAAMAVAWRWHRMRARDLTSTGPALFFVGLIMVALLGALASLSRGGLLSAGIIVTAWIVVEYFGARRFMFAQEEAWQFTSRQKMTAVLIAALLGTMIFSASIVEGFTRRFELGDGQVRRSDIAGAALRGFAQSRFLGVGLGGTEFAINQNAHWPTATNAIWAHDDYLQVVVELGLPGLIICLPLLWWALKAFRVPLRAMADGEWWERNLLSRAAVAGVVIALLHAVSDFHLRIPLVGFQFLILLAVAAVPFRARRGAAARQGGGNTR